MRGEDKVSVNTNLIRLNAGWKGTHCTTCTRPVNSPHRRHDSHGHVVEGCVDASHTGHLYGESARWHNSKVAKDIRRLTYDSLKRLGKR